MRWLWQLFSRRRLYTDLGEEIAQHLQEKTDELVSHGVSRREAELQARREFGNVARIEERSRRHGSGERSKVSGPICALREPARTPPAAR
jgi:hypothetical protein